MHIISNPLRIQCILQEVVSCLLVIQTFPWSSSDGDGTGDDLVLQHDADHQENEVKHEHEEAEQLAHSPLAGSDGDDDEDEHEEEQHDGTEQAVTAHRHWLQVVKERVEQPREGQPAEKGQQKNRKLDVY